MVTLMIPSQMISQRTTRRNLEQILDCAMVDLHSLDFAMGDSLPANRSDDPER